MIYRFQQYFATKHNNLMINTRSSFLILICFAFPVISHALRGLLLCGGVRCQGPRDNLHLQLWFFANMIRNLRSTTFCKTMHPHPQTLRPWQVTRFVSYYDNTLSKFWKVCLHGLTCFNRYLLSYLALITDNLIHLLISCCICNNYSYK